jgi:uncharacterized membrane protein
VFEGTTTTTVTTTTTTLPPVQVESPSDLIKHCQQPIIIGTLASTVLVGAITSVIFGIFMSKMATSMLKPPSLSRVRH